MSADTLAGQMRTAALSLLGRLDEEQRALAIRRWRKYRPQYRPGAYLAELTHPRKASHRLLVTGPSE